MATLKVQNLIKYYNNAKYVSANNISFEVREGEIFGFLGINGAGKSTTIKSITGIIPYTSGSIEICGHDLSDDPLSAKSNFGFVPDNHAVYDKLTGVQYVNYLADLYKVPTEERKATFEKLAKIFNMENSVGNQIASYSHGMKQKISIMGALIHSPKLWILDEPMVGLDPQSIFEVKNYMKEYAKAGNSVLFSSHNLDTVEKLCDRAIVVHGGRLIKEFDLNEYRTSKKSLEDEFIALTQAQTKVQNQEKVDLATMESEMAVERGKLKASRAIIKMVAGEVKSAIEEKREANVRSLIIQSTEHRTQNTDNESSVIKESKKAPSKKKGGDGDEVNLDVN